MIIKIALEDLKNQLFKQLDSFFMLDHSEKYQIEQIIPCVLNRVEKCFAATTNKYYWEGDQNYFNPYQSAQYTIFLYFLSNSIAKTNTTVADKVYYLNKIMNGCDLYHQVELPDIFFLDHPVGSVMGRAKYGNGFSFGQNCTVGNNNGVYPIMGENVRLCSGASVIGKCIIGNNVTLGAAALVKDQNIEDNSIVFGSSPNLIIKSKK